MILLSKTIAHNHTLLKIAKQKKIQEVCLWLVQKSQIKNGIISCLQNHKISAVQKKKKKKKKEIIISITVYEISVLVFVYPNSPNTYLQLILYGKASEWTALSINNLWGPCS